MNCNYLLILTVLSFILTSVQSRYETGKRADISVVDKISDESSLNTTPDMMNDIVIFPDDTLVSPDNRNVFETYPTDKTEELTTSETTEETTLFDFDNKVLIDAPQRSCGENMKRDNHGVCRTSL